MFKIIISNVASSLFSEESTNHIYNFDFHLSLVTFGCTKSHIGYHFDLSYLISTEKICFALQYYMSKITTIAEFLTQIFLLKIKIKLLLDVI